jgi:putative membrane protein
MPEFTWAWHPHPEVWALVGALGFAYARLVRTVGPKRVAPGEAVLTASQRRCAIWAGIVLFISAEWPMHDLAEGYLYSAHMIQHMLLTLVFAPLVLKAMPAWMMRAILPPPLMRVVRAVSRPLIALVIFNLMIVFTHWPALVTASVGSEVLHLSVHVALVGSALIMWMPVFSPVIEIPRLALPTQLMYLFLQSLVPTVPASFLTFGTRPLYKVYELYPTPFGFTDLADQTTAGLIMKIAGGAILWGVMAVLYFRWYRMERDGGDAFGLRDLDRSLDASLTKVDPDLEMEYR